jgi:peptidoglycan-N-acetylglucosamine deacetylase
VIWRVIGIVTLVAAGLAEVIVRASALVPGVADASRPVIYGLMMALDAVVLIAMLERRAPLFGRVFWRGPDDERRLAAITFDDGPNEVHTPRILDILRDKDVKGTFFVIGRHVERLPGIVERAASEGHEIGNHGYDHRVLPLRGPQFTRDQIGRAAVAIEAACDRRPALFRAPHGWRNPWVNREARRAACRTVAWTLGVWDTDRPGRAEIERRAARGLAPGCVLLLHDGRGMDTAADASQVVEALPSLIDTFRKNGYRLVTLSELIGESVRKSARKPR